MTFEAFLIRKLVQKLWKWACVVMDNCSIHLGEEAEKAIKKRAKLIYLSTYLPDFMTGRQVAPSGWADIQAAVDDKCKKIWN
ncbi:transposase [Tychonema sp. LEGE 07199]|uniref:transposase n=1 Tax=unclassified Tychonema TaxID=2642144 RepID=UPI0018828578|nr:transposase [Tychonema sp. LEGE 07199]MBE9131452.1 transposase [Tychonema sp. LEGE 07196]